MGNDLFGGLGGLMKGLSGLMPQDDPNVKLMNAQGDLDGLKKQENELYVEIGKLAYQRDGAAAWPGQAEKLNLVQMNIADAEEKLGLAKQQKSEAEQAKKTADAASCCPACGHQNPEGTRFCQECGGKLGGLVCTQCGAALSPGTRFCGECGGPVAGG